MKKRVVAIVAIVALVGLLLPATVFAADTGTVTCTVSAVMVSVSVSPGSVAYGTVNVGATKDTLSDPNQTLTATNDGSAAEDFKIKSSDATGSSQNWTLADTASAEHFTHKVSTNSGSSWPIVMQPAGTYFTLATGIAHSGSQTFDLQIGMPTSTTDYGAHSITVTVLAVQPGG
jgi:hypothetical protein